MPAAPTRSTATLANLSVFKKLAVSFGVIVLLLGAVAGTAIWSASRMSSATHEIGKVAAPKAQAAEEVKGLSFYIHEAQSRYVLNRGSSRGDFMGDLEAWNAGMAKLARVSRTPADRAQLAGIQAAYAKWIRIDGTINADVAAGRQAAAVGIVNGAEDSQSDALRGAVDAYIAYADGEQAAAAAAFGSSKDLALWLMIGIGAAAAVIATFLGLALTRAIRNPLRAVEHAAKTAAGGDLSVDVEVTGNDELGHMAAAFRRMVEQLRETVGEVASTAETLSSASQQMATTSDEAGQAVVEIARAVDDVAQGAERQVKAVQTARQAADEVSRAVEESAASTQETARVAAEARTVAGHGVEAAAHATAAMEAVCESTGSVTDAIRGLAAKSEQIGGIVETITGIASQTNLLALNAAIEAARAGEQGRGFAVVAEEVRKLAEESQQAATKISDLIEEIQTETHRTVEVVEDGARRTEDGVAVVQQAREAFQEIGRAVDDMTGRIDEVATAARQITAAAAQMREGMDEAASVAEDSSAAAEQVSASTEQTSASTKEIASAAQDLAATATRLQELVGRFTLAAAD